jgi:hypothetical protein
VDTLILASLLRALGKACEVLVLNEDCVLEHAHLADVAVLEILAQQRLKLHVSFNLGVLPFLIRLIWRP